MKFLTNIKDWFKKYFNFSTIHSKKEALTFFDFMKSRMLAFIFLTVIIVFLIIENVREYETLPFMFYVLMALMFFTYAMLIYKTLKKWAHLREKSYSKQNKRKK